MPHSYPSESTDDTNQPTVLEVGCGNHPDPRADLTTDVLPHETVDAQADATRLPVQDNVLEGVIARHIVEHLDDPSLFFAEAARVIKPGGWIEIRVPLGVNHRNDGDHKHPWSWERPEQYSKSHRRPWDPDLPLDLVDRKLNVWLMGPFGWLSPIFRLLARVWPNWAAYRTAGGELIVRYRVRDSKTGSSNAETATDQRRLP